MQQSSGLSAVVKSATGTVVKLVEKGFLLLILKLFQKKNLETCLQMHYGMLILKPAVNLIYSLIIAYVNICVTWVKVLTTFTVVPIKRHAIQPFVLPTYTSIALISHKLPPACNYPCLKTYLTRHVVSSLQSRSLRARPGAGPRRRRE